MADGVVPKPTGDVTGGQKRLHVLFHPLRGFGIVDHGGVEPASHLEIPIPIRREDPRHPFVKPPDGRKEHHILPSGVVELHKQLGSMGVHPFRRFAERLNIPVVGHGQHAGVSHGVRPVHTGAFGDHEPHASGGPLLVIGGKRVAHRAVVVGKPDTHGGHDQTVFDRHRADPPGCKQMGIFHI